MRTGGVEPPQPWQRLYRPRSSPMLSVRTEGEGRPAGIEPAPRGSRPRMLAVTPRPPRSGDDRIRTGGVSVDSRALWASELRPRSSAGGIRTHGLELMRLARTASPLPRSLSGWSRTSGLLLPKQAGWPGFPTDRCSTPGGTRTRGFPVEGRASSPLDHGGVTRGRRRWNRTSPCSISASRAATDTGLRREQAPAAGLEPAPRD
jgi:hypothetical protein